VNLKKTYSTGVDREFRRKMSALGRKQTFRSAITMSALPPKTFAVH
jgi:hypothetical protein